MPHVLLPSPMPIADCSKKSLGEHSRAFISFVTVLIFGSMFLPSSSLEIVTVARPLRRATSSWVNPRSLRIRIRLADENNGSTSLINERMFV